MSNKQAYEQKLRAEIDKWSAEIDKLKARAESMEADARLEYHHHIDQLRELQQAASDRLDEIRDASDDAWEDLKVGVDAASIRIREAFQDARARF